MAEFTMPSLGADMDAGTLLEWHVKPGDSVKRGDIVALVDTDKAAIEVEIFEDGVIGELLVPPGQKVPVGTVLATVLPEGTAVGEAAVGARPMATPAARTHARALGIDLSTVLGTGRHGVIMPEDVDAAAQSAEAAVAATATRPAETAASSMEAAPGRATPVPPDASAATAATVPPPPAPAPTTAGDSERHVRASPLARRLASELGVDLATVRGSGPGGAVTQEDVRAARAGRGPAAPTEPAEAPAVAAPEAAGEAKPEDARYAAMRRAIAAAMSKSKREIPHYYLSLHVDMTRPLAWLEEANLKRAVTERILPAALVLKATALAAREVPEVNGFYVEDGFHPSDAVHLGVGISLRQGGLIAPAIHDVDRMDLDALMAALRDLVTRTRKLQLRSSELSDATMTTTNLGDQGVESVYGVIYPPQVALVGYGRVVERPWAENGMLAARRQMQLTLAADHRASDGHRGGLFLSAIERHLQHPEEL